MSKLSKDYVSDSDSDDEVISNEFSIPDGFKKCKHLKNFPLNGDNKKKSETATGLADQIPIKCGHLQVKISASRF